MGLLANPPSLEPRPNFFNLRALQTHFACALKKVSWPQSAVNGWAKAVLAPAIYALIDSNVFHWTITTTAVPAFPARFVQNADGTQGASLPYSREEILTITAKHVIAKHYHDIGLNVCRACFNVLDAHNADAYKTAPAGSPNTVRCNSRMLPNEIFDQLMTTFGKPTPGAMCQNNLTLISTYNPKDPPKLLFKHCADCQEIAIIAKVPYTMEQLLMNVVNLFTCLGIYARNTEDWKCKPDANKTYFNLRPFIQAAYQCRLASGVITTTQSGYSYSNCFAGLTTKDNVSDDGTTETIVESINMHMANISVFVLSQSNALNNPNTAIFNSLMQQVAANEAQCNNNHNRMLQQFAMMTMNPPGAQQFSSQFSGQPAFRSQAATQCNFVPPAILMLAPAQQLGQPPRGGGRGGNHSPNDSAILAVWCNRELQSPSLAVIR